MNVIKEIYEPFSYDNLPEKLVDNIVVLRQLPTETCDQRIQYIDLYFDCDSELRALGYFIQAHRYSIITGIEYAHSPTTAQMKMLIKRYRGKCAICGFSIISFLIPHHIIPRRLGGNNNDSNFLPVCPICHKLIHMIERNSVKNNGVDMYIKTHKLTDKLNRYTEHLSDYFSDYIKSPDLLAEWL